MKGAGLLYLMGPSGSGKDTLLELLPTYLPSLLRSDARVHIARRSITRLAEGEASESLTHEEFARRLSHGEFALHWQSHGLCYGIGIEIERWLAQAAVVIVNGSRAYLPCAHARYPGLTAVSVVVRPEVLAERLRGRAREDDAAIAARLARAQTAFDLPAACRHVQIDNNHAPEVAARALAGVVRAMLQSTSSPAPVPMLRI